MPLQITLGEFYGIDSLIDFFILLVAGVISYQSRKIYKLVNEKSYKFFSWSFLAISIAFIFKIIANLTTKYTVIIQNPNFAFYVVHELKEMQIIHFSSILAYKAILTIGFLLLFLIITKNSTKENTILFVYLSIMAVILSIYFNFIFHLTLVLILSILTLYFKKNYEAKKTKSGLSVALAFIFILFSNLLEIFQGSSPLVYFASEISLLIGFLILFINHLNLKNGKETNKIRSNK